MERIGHMFTTHSTNNTASQLSYTPMLVMGKCKFNGDSSLTHSTYVHNMSHDERNLFCCYMVKDGSSENSSDVPSSCRQSVIQPLPYGLDGLDLEVAPHSVPFPRKDVLENAIADYSQQVSDLQKQLSEVPIFDIDQVLFSISCGTLFLISILLYAFPLEYNSINLILQTHEQHERQNFSFRQSIVKLQTKLLQVQMEKDAIADLR